ncbi:lytic transglycosylase domain-containing protein [Tissierella sp. MB52-C2]|uniref:lytic transglycosylase domain-containing protein n=1 Tax=Tissierella sp. MB52-C2 TaxID=3070999 RepID=UPI00280A5F0B|nr:lytic transglycosylase domain-containing protein [Tissierella sp. MB52-C2]WMM23586.1 lytic transglycosylase domain-containing protein [Tissierella sp. MB52-C2]
MLFKMKKLIKKTIIFFTIIILIIIGSLVVLTTKYPIGYKSAIVKYSNEYNLDPYLVASIINVESKYDKNAVSSKEAKGLMQIAPQTGQWASEVLGIENYNEKMLFDPEINIRIGTWYLNNLFTEFNQNLDLVLAAYNAGSGNVNKWLDNDEYCKDGVELSVIPFKETRDYLVRIKDNYKVYSSVYKEYIMNPTEKDSLYINLLHNIKRVIKELVRNI